MKQKSYSIMIILLVGMAFSFSSCLKDSKNYVNVSQSAALAELPLSAYWGVGNLAVDALPISTTTQVIQVAVNVAVATPLSTATTFKLALDPDAIAAFNTANQAANPGAPIYTALPTADYTVPTWTATVPAGQHLAYIKVNVNTSIVDPAGHFILPIKIVSAGGLTIDQYNELLLNVLAKNQYDGDYNYTYTSNLGNSTTTETLDMSTTGPNSLTYSLLNEYSNAVNITINPTTNAVTVDIPSLEPTVTTSGTYDPATKTFHLVYTAAGGKYTFDETMVAQ